jgi:hydroxymethylpyrimidine/phosphomethylpyrimidine kinase
MVKRPVALSIAGSDSGGGAGIQADLKTFQLFGVWGTTAVTAVTAQDTTGVHDALVLPAAMVRAQIDAVAGDIGVDAVKTGMLGSASVIDVVVAAISEHAFAHVVVDPVIVTSHGDPLLEPGAIGRVRDELLPLAEVVTPNIPEAEALIGQTIRSREDMASAVVAIGALGARAVLLKGGHLEGPMSPDLLWHGGRMRWIEGERLETRHTHGTGCTLSAAICAQLAQEVDLATACVRGKDYVTAALRPQAVVGRGIGPVDPGGPPSR